MCALPHLLAVELRDVKDKLATCVAWLLVPVDYIWTRARV